MFVTIWLGILDVNTGLLTASNAGHEYPVVKNPGGKYEFIKDKHGLAVGAYVTSKYMEYEIHLEKGSMVFIYTDGVVEATDANEQLFGNDRLLDALNGSAEDTPESALDSVSKAVKKFVKGAPQFDDLTMLCLKFNGK
jgi:sigma-B regulation protein RsbU (phosphoserine phosphatase)